MMSELQSKRATMGKKLEGDLLTVADHGRFLGDIGSEDRQSALIVCSVEELVTLVKEAIKMKKSALYKNNDRVHLFYKHLSQDVTFGFVEQDSSWLTLKEDAEKAAAKALKRKKRKKRATSTSKTKRRRKTKSS